MVNSTDVQTILDADLLCLIRKYRITKVRSRQAVKLPAVQPIVMWTPALGRIERKIGGVLYDFKTNLSVKNI